MLILVLLDMGTHVSITGSKRVLAFPVIQNGIQFVVAHDGDGVASGLHVSDNLDDGPIVRSAVNEVAQECRPAALRVPPNAAFFDVAECRERPFKTFQLTMNVGDNVETYDAFLLLSNRIANLFAWTDACNAGRRLKPGHTTEFGACRGGFPVGKE